VINVGLCGFGYWGPNLFRVFSSTAGFRVGAVAEPMAERRARVPAGAKPALFERSEEMIDDASIQAVVVATPVSEHFALAARALKKGKHVLVEKPMCASIDEARELVAIAERSGATLMVDHTFVFHGAVQKLYELKRTGVLGTVSYYDSLRVNLGLFQPDVNVLWDLGPHDFSIMDHLFDEEPLHVEATGYCHVNPGIPDIAFVTVHFASQMIAHFNLSWMSPVKVRRVAIGGSNQMVVWDDLNREERLKIYDSGIHFQPEEQRRALIPSYRIGDVLSPRIADSEPLAAVAQHFHDVIAGNARSLMDGRKGLRIVTLLERAQRSLDSSLGTLADLRTNPGASVRVAARGG
jgi:predicted dehydrogenase